MMLRLKDIARNQGMIILASIHQPSNDVFQAFDDLLLLHKSGRQLFSGSIADSTSITRHLSLETWSHANQAEQLLHVATQPCTFASHNSRSTPQVSTLSALPSRRERSSPVDQIAIFYILVHRGFLKAFRDATAYAIRAVMFSSLALLAGTVWYDWNLRTGTLNRLSTSSFSVVHSCHSWRWPPFRHTLKTGPHSRRKEQTGFMGLRCLSFRIFLSASHSY